MISMFSLHFHYLFSWKVIYVSLIMFLLSVICFLFFSRFYYDYDLLLYDSEYYLGEYYFESINYLKIVIVLYNMFLVINGLILNKYDLFLLIRRNRKQVIISKIITLLLGNIVLTVILYLLFLITGLYLTPYMEIDVTSLALLGDLIIFGGAYLLTYILIYFYSKGTYSLLIIVVGYFISDITIEYYVLRSNVSNISKVINFVFMNIGYYQDTGYGLYYGKIWGIILIIVLFLGIVLLYEKNDIVN